MCVCVCFFFKYILERSILCKTKKKEKKKNQIKPNSSLRFVGPVREKYTFRSGIAIKRDKNNDYPDIPYIGNEPYK